MTVRSDLNAFEKNITGNAIASFLSFGRTTRRRNDSPVARHMTICYNGFAINIATVCTSIKLHAILCAGRFHCAFIVCMTKFRKRFFTDGTKDVSKLLLATIIIREVQLARRMSRCRQRNGDIFIAIVAISRITSCKGASRLIVEIIIGYDVTCSIDDLYCVIIASSA